LTKAASRYRHRFGQYRIGMRLDFQRPACMTDARSMLSANKYWVAPP